PLRAASLDLDVCVSVVADQLHVAADLGRFLHLLQLTWEVVVGPREPVQRHAAEFCSQRPLRETARRGEPERSRSAHPQQPFAGHRAIDVFHCSSSLALPGTGARTIPGRRANLPSCGRAVYHAERALPDVFVEKPLCITLADADRIVAARDRAGKVVQVGNMKRFDPAWERMLAELPDSAEELRYVRVMCHDPEWVPFFAEGDIVKGPDVPTEVIAATKRAEADQVEEAVGTTSADAVFAFSDAYLGSLVHD